MITWLIAQFATLGLPEPLRKVAAWGSVVLAALALLWAGKAIYDHNVIADHEKDRAVESIGARDDAADARASDAITNSENERKRDEAIENAGNGGELSPAARALGCQRLRERGGSLPSVCRHQGRD